MSKSYLENSVNELAAALCVAKAAAEAADRAKAKASATAESLAKSESFLRILADNIPGMVGYWTSDLRCSFANKHYLEWFGKTPEQMLGIRIQDLMGENLFKKNEQYIRAALRGERQEFERVLTKADGSIGYSWAHYIPDVEGIRVKGFFVLVADITTFKKRKLNSKDFVPLSAIPSSDAKFGAVANQNSACMSSEEVELWKKSWLARATEKRAQFGATKSVRLSKSPRKRIRRLPEKASSSALPAGPRETD
jgi:PAS domain S-box-containing protein